jgi:hypothetical protein
VNEGQWLVDQKIAGATAAAAPSAYGPTAPASRAIILRSATGAALAGSTLTIASESTPSATQAAAIRVAPQDAEDLSDILSVGSRVIVRR